RQGLQASRNIGSGIGVDRPTTALVAGIHCCQKVTDLGSAYLTYHQPIRTDAQGLTDQVSQAENSSSLGVDGSTLDSHDIFDGPAQALSNPRRQRSAPVAAPAAQAGSSYPSRFHR